MTSASYSRTTSLTVVRPCEHSDELSFDASSSVCKISITIPRTLYAYSQFDRMLPVIIFVERPRRYIPGLVNLKPISYNTSDDA